MNRKPDILPRAKIRHPDVIDARERAHAAFDQLWKSPNGMTRDSAYAWLSTAMNLPPREAHIGKMHIEQCDKLVKLIAAKLDERKVSSMGDISFGKLRDRLVKMDAILQTELIRTLLEVADHTTMNAVTANGRIYLLTRELEQARADLAELRSGALEELAALRAEIEKDAAERAELRRRTEDLERRIAETLEEAR